MQSKTRTVTTRSGQVFTVPAGISRNHGAGCWVVTWGKRDWLPKAFGARGDAAALGAAKRELARRQAIAKKRGDIPNMCRTERRNKAMTFGRSGINFKVSNRRSGYFTVRVEHLGRRKTLNLAIRFNEADYPEQVGRQWRVAIAVRDWLDVLIARGRWDAIRSLRSSRLPSSVATAAKMLDISNAAVSKLARSLRQQRDALT
jgi:hypothetical protein